MSRRYLVTLRASVLHDGVENRMTVERVILRNTRHTACAAAVAALQSEGYVRVKTVYVHPLRSQEPQR